MKMSGMQNPEALASLSLSFGLGPCLNYFPERAVHNA